jgi:hypothetical protein
MLETLLDSILSNVLEIIAAIISLVVAYYVIPCIKNDLVPWLKEKRLHSTVKNFVQAAEKLAESGVIEKVNKKSEVIKLLNKNGIVVDETIEAFIESCVKELDLVTSIVYEEITETEVESETTETENN